MDEQKLTPSELMAHWRKAAGLTQREAAEVLCYRTSQTISDKERGAFDVHERDLKLIRQHARINGIDLPEITKETEPTE